jgi:hypothetical protein
MQIMMEEEAVALRFHKKRECCWRTVSPSCSFTSGISISGMSRYLVRSLFQILERDRGKHPGFLAVPYNAGGDDPPTAGLVLEVNLANVSTVAFDVLQETTPASRMLLILLRCRPPSSAMPKWLFRSLLGSDWASPEDWPNLCA